MSVGGRLLATVIGISLVTAACIKPPDDGGGGGGGGTSPKIAGCSVFPATNAWNTKIDKLVVRRDSSTLIANISTPNHTRLHADFGGNGEYGIPFMVVPEALPKVGIHYTAYGDESDPGPFPIPGNAPVEGGAGSDGDRHVLVLQQKTCHLYELGRGFWRGDHWDATVGVNWDLASNALRPLYWTSADAAGLPILPGLVRYDEVKAGHIDHAVRFTVPNTQRGFILPATHFASSSNNAALPAMGLRLRLKTGFDLSHFHGESLVILKALKTFGMIVADNGSSWYITGASDPRWDDDDLNQLKTVPGTAFEALDTGPVHH
jgi:hypothetical protein